MITEVKGHELDKIKLSLDGFELIKMPGLSTPIKKLTNFAILTNSKKKTQELSGKYFIVDLSSFSYFHLIHSQIGQYELLKSKMSDIQMLMMVESQHNLDALMAKSSKVISDLQEIYGIDDIIIYSNTNTVVEEVYFYNPRSRIIELLDESFPTHEVASASDEDFYAYSIEIAKLINKKFAPYISKVKNRKTYMLDVGKVTNQDTIGSWAVSKKYHVFEPAKAGLFEQINAASSSSVILSVHGSNLTNIMFCTPRTHVIALNPYPNYLWFYKDIADALGLKMTIIDTPTSGVANTERLFGDK